MLRGKAEKMQGCCHMKMEAEIRIMLLQIKECLGLPELGKARKESSSPGFRRSMAKPTP